MNLFDGNPEGSRAIRHNQEILDAFAMGVEPGGIDIGHRLSLELQMGLECWFLHKRQK